MKKIINVVAAVILNENKVFCAQRSITMSLPLLWEFPGGKIEFNETPEEALIRELKEELDCTVEIEEFITQTCYEYPFGIVNLTTFKCRLTSDHITLKEHAQSMWVSIDSLDNLEWAPADLETVELVQTKFQFRK